VTDEHYRDTLATGTSLRAFPWAAAFAVAIIFSIEIICIQPRWASWTEPLNQVIHMKKQRLMSPGLVDKVAILGDSRMFHVEPARVMKALHLDGRADNYAWAWCGYEAYDAVLRGLISYKDSPPKAVIVSSHPEMPAYVPQWTTVGGNADMRERLFQAAPVLSQIETLVLLHEYANGWQQFERTLMPPSFVYAPSIRTWLKDRIHHRPYDTLPVERQRIVSKYEADGAFMYHASGEVKPAELQEFEKTAGPFKVHKNTLARNAFSQFLATAQAHNVQVIMIALPVPQPIFDIYSQRGILADYAAQVKQWEKKYPIFHPVGNVALRYPIEDFLDPGHVNEKGREKHEKTIDEALESLAPKLKW
jgi:hypothetical protein